MSRMVGQVTTREALLGGLAAVLVVAAVVLGARALVPRAELPPDPGAAPPAEPVPPCPTPRETVPRVAPPQPSGSPPVPVTSQELLECPARFDGRPVRYAGEVVRAVLRRGERAWVQLNDDAYGLRIGPLPRHHTPAGANSGMAVSIPAADADRISAVGDSTGSGDRLLVEGTFRRADPADAGGPAIEASRVEITAVGQPIDRRVTPARLVVALVLAAAAGAAARGTAVRDRMKG